MHQKMTSVYRNWKLNLLAMVCISLFIALGCWQLSRAQQKESVQHAFALRSQLPPMQIGSFHQHEISNTTRDMRFYRATLTGGYDNKHTMLLDNKVFHGQVGYEVYTPFKFKLRHDDISDRGFIGIGQSRNNLPLIADIISNITINGMFNLPPKLFTFGGMLDVTVNNWPKRIEYINLTKVAQLIEKPANSIYPYVLLLSPGEPSAFAVEWQAVTMGPEKHKGYALQWFAFALTLLILFVALNLKKGKT